MKTRTAITLIEMLVVISSIALLIGIFLPALGEARKSGNPPRNSSNLRGIAQSMVIYGNSNNGFFPGIDSSGKIVSPSLTSTGSTTASGAALSSRLWILLDAQFVGGDLLVGAYGDSLTQWVSGNSLTSSNFSYAGLQIADGPSALTPGNNVGRFAEWKNNTNSQAIVMSDRLCVPTDTTDIAAKSLWTTKKEDWKGWVVWADVHAEF